MLGVTFRPFTPGPKVSCKDWLPFDAGETRVLLTDRAEITVEAYPLYFNKNAAYVFDILVLAENAAGAFDRKHLCYIALMSSTPSHCTLPPPTRDVIP